MQIYISEEFFQGYHVNFPVTASHRSNGMRSRMSSLGFALRIPIISDLSQAEGTVIVEPFATKPRESDRRDFINPHEDPASIWKQFQNKYADEIFQYDRGDKYLLCSEMEVFRWSGDFRNKLIASMQGVFTTCNYQENLLAALNIMSERLSEPINEYLFYPGIKVPNQLVALGSANHQKNTEMLIEFYRSLEGKGYNRVYIGGPTLWADMKEQARDDNFAYNLELYHELKSVCDTFYEASPGTVVARVLSESEYYVNFAFHEVGCRTLLEALMSGCKPIWGKHPLGKEVPTVCCAGTAEEAVEALMTDAGDLIVDELRAFALANYSFESVLRQFRRFFHAN